MTTTINTADTLPNGFNLLWYEIKTVLGRGGFGITYLAEDTNLHSKVAVKEFMPTAFVTRDSHAHTLSPLSNDDGDLYEWGLKRFRSEAQTLAKFNHPNIIKVLSVFDENNTAYMVMEYEQGVDLSILNKRGKKLSEQALLEIFLPILDGLYTIHNEGFIHRDIKPANIFIRADHTPVLIDFGSARQPLEAKTQALTSLVTHGYTPFEQYNMGGKHQGPWTDLYSIGATLYYLVTGSLPIDAMARGQAIMNNEVDPYIPIRNHDLAKPYSEHFLNAIDHALEFHAEKRPQNAKMLAAMLNGTQATPTRYTQTNTHPILTHITQGPTRIWLALAVTLVVTLCLYIVFADYLIAPEADSIKHSPQDIVRETTPLTASEESSLPGVQTNIKDAANNKEAEKQEQTKLQFNNLLTQAQLALNKSFWFSPAQANAYYYFNEAELLIPNAPAAKAGQAKVRLQYEKNFQHLLARKTPAAIEQATKKLTDLKETLAPISYQEKLQLLLEKAQLEYAAESRLAEEQKAKALLAQRLSELEQQRHNTNMETVAVDESSVENQKRPNFETALFLIAQFKGAFEQNDLEKLTAIADIPSQQQQFLTTLFSEYRSNQLDFSEFNYIEKDRSADINATIKTLESNEGRIVVPASEWKSFRLKLESLGGNNWKIYWQP